MLSGRFGSENTARRLNQNEKESSLSRIWKLCDEEKTNHDGVNKRNDQTRLHVCLLQTLPRGIYPRAISWKRIGKNRLRTNPKFQLLAWSLTGMVGFPEKAMRITRTTAKAVKELRGIKLWKAMWPISRNDRKRGRKNICMHWSRR